MKSYKKYVYTGLPILGVLFYLLYLHTAAIDMVYSDYIRLINSYLPDVWNPEKFFVADLLTRIPVNYLERIVNVTFFGYSVTFDRVLSILSFGASALIIGVYCKKQRIGLGWYTAIMVFMFSLNKWEMLYNGTGWAHFLAFACFFYHYLVLDRVYRNRARGGDMVRLLVLPVVITIGVAGPYCAIYSMTLILSYGFILMRNGYLKTQGKIVRSNRSGAPTQVSGAQIAALLVAVLLPLFLYIWSNSQAVYEHVGAVEGSLVGTFFQEPQFFLKFLLKAFASIVFGVEFINRTMPDVPGMFWYLIGLLVLVSYFLALWMNFYYGLTEKTIMPLMLLAGGGMNHLIVLVSRWIFMKDTYGMSSRYALQYQVGILGILLTFALVYRRKEKKRSPWIRTAALLLTAVIVAGNVATTVEEFHFGQHRKNHNLEVKEVLLNFENEDEETLKTNLEYFKPGTREALQILKDNGWNIFKEEN